MHIYKQTDRQAGTSSCMMHAQMKIYKFMCPVNVHAANKSVY